jgi:hypothetical protein
MRRVVFAAAVVFISVAGLLAADDMSVNADPATDFSKLRSFTLGPGTVISDRPELDNALFIKLLGRAIRADLVERGVSEAAANPDLTVTFKVENRDYTSSERGAPAPVLAGPRGGARLQATGPVSVRFTEATLQIDMTSTTARGIVWTGVFREQEPTGSKLVQKLPDDARRLIARFPPKS